MSLSRQFRHRFQLFSDIQVSVILDGGFFFFYLVLVYLDCSGDKGVLQMIVYPQIKPGG